MSVDCANITENLIGICSALLRSSLETVTIRGYPYQNHDCPINLGYRCLGGITNGRRSKNGLSGPGNTLLASHNRDIALTVLYHRDL